MDKDLSVAELLEKYPYLKKLSNYLFLSKSDYDRYFMAEKIKYNATKLQIYACVFLYILYKEKFRSLCL